MKIVIWIVVLALVVWGLWAWMGGNGAADNAGTGAAATEALDSGEGENMEGETDDVDISEFEDKG